MREFSSPLDWLHTIRNFFGDQLLLTSMGVMLILAVVGIWWRKLTFFATAALLVVAAEWMGFVAYDSGIKPGFGGGVRADVWSIFVRWWEGICNPFVLAQGLAFVGLIAWQSSSATLVGRCRRAGRLMVGAALVILACWGVYALMNHRFNKAAAEMTLDHHVAPGWETYVQTEVKDHGVPMPAAAEKRVRADYPDWDQARVKQFAAEQIETKKRRWQSLLAARHKADRSLTDAQLERSAAEQIASEKVVWERWVSIWMPRYVGMCWPAVAIAACALLLRVPGRPLRWIGITLLLAVNMIQAGARIYADTEPPLARIFADVAASQRGSTHTYLHHMNPPNIGHPGSLGIFGMSGRYYLTQSAKISISPVEFRNFFSSPRSGKRWEPWNFVFRFDEPARRIADELSHSPDIRRAIIWEPVDRDAGDTISMQLAPLLGTGWKRVPEERFEGRYHWTWEKVYTVRRVVFERVE